MVNRPVLTQFVLDWLQQSQSPRVLHVFKRACNLVNEQDEIISLVCPDLGAGPFALVLPDERPFTQITTHSIVNITKNHLQLDHLPIVLEEAILWQPRLNWETIQQNKHLWPEMLPRLQMILSDNVPAETAVFQPRLSDSKQELLSGIQTNNHVQIEYGTSQLAGLGQGLTPTGDDFLVGVMIGLWTMGENLDAINLLVQTAVPRTTKLSGAWLKAAGRGELVVAWHNFFAGLQDGSWETTIANILQIGYSSGHDALTGFTAVLATFNQGV